MNNRKLCSCIHSVSMYAASSSQLTVGWELREYKNGQINVALAFEDVLYSGCQSKWKQNQGLFFTETEVKDCVRMHPCFMRPSLPMPRVLSCFLSLWYTPWPKATLWGKGWFLSYGSQPFTEGSRGRNLRHNPEARNWSMGCGGITLTDWLAQCSPGPPMSKSGPAHSRLSLRMSITDEEGTLWACPQAISQLRFPLPRRP